MELQNTNVKDMTYRQAVNELDAILREMQSENCDIDKLSAMTRRATELITECRNRLTATDEELRNILGTLSTQG